MICHGVTLLQCHLLATSTAQHKVVCALSVDGWDCKPLRVPILERRALVSAVLHPYLNLAILRPRGDEKGVVFNQVYF